MFMSLDSHLIYSIDLLLRSRKLWQQILAGVIHSLLLGASHMNMPLRWIRIGGRTPYSSLLQLYYLRSIHTSSFQIEVDPVHYTCLKLEIYSIRKSGFGLRGMKISIVYIFREVYNCQI